MTGARPKNPHHPSRDQHHRYQLRSYMLPTVDAPKTPPNTKRALHNDNDATPHPPTLHRVGRFRGIAQWDYGGRHDPVRRRLIFKRHVLGGGHADTITFHTCAVKPEIIDIDPFLDAHPCFACAADLFLTSATNPSVDKNTPTSPPTTPGHDDDDVPASILSRPEARCARSKQQSIRQNRQC
ncbi:unnamed protein product [Zymoseptoria tritici ST99CH_1A5]|uniref:Uncharacterized protein n=1 Tax=Zymoseptoria tritici ST99CH_1A5 TaxID=1276529 RepID=A0A1Y6M0M3_ZYMTR|nr:unnamed protein product [Zymoseptoria tritici ST99CH_1A5]